MQLIITKNTPSSNRRLKRWKPVFMRVFSVLICLWFYSGSKNRVFLIQSAFCEVYMIHNVDIVVSFRTRE